MEHDSEIYNHKPARDMNGSAWHVFYTQVLIMAEVWAGYRKGHPDSSDVPDGNSN